MRITVLSLKKILLPIGLVLLAAGFVFFGKESYNGAAAGASLCSGTVIPSVFPFMCLSFALSESGGGELFSRLLGFPSKLLFGRLGCYSYIYLLSVLGGYPTAAVIVNALFKRGEISNTDAGRLLIFCFCPTPSFCITAVGLKMFGSQTVGIVLYASCVLSSLLIGSVVCRIGYPRRFSFVKKGKAGAEQRKCSEKIEKIKRRKIAPPQEILVMSVEKASRSVITLCAVIIFCSSALSVIKAFVHNTTVINALTCIFETTSAVEYSSKNLTVFVTAAILSFGGLSTFIQSAALAKELFPNAALFLLSRALTAALSYGICRAAVSLLGVSVASAWRPVCAGEISVSGSPAVSVLLVLSAVSLCLSLAGTEKGKDPAV